jgi:ABC-2 type transport system permease protein
LPHEPEGRTLTLAGEVRSSTGERPLHAIVIADLDFISDQVFSMRRSGSRAATLDNVTFFLNSIDVLAGDVDFIGLRTRRVRYRTLERVEAQTRGFLERRSQEERQAADDARRALDAAQQTLDQRVADIEGRQDLDAQARQILVRNLLDTENRKLEVLRTNIEQARDTKILASREAMDREVRRIQGAIRTTAVLAPPLPVLLIGLLVYFRRRRRERDGAAAMRRLRTGP